MFEANEERMENREHSRRALKWNQDVVLYWQQHFESHGICVVLVVLASRLVFQASSFQNFAYFVGPGAERKVFAVRV